MSASSSDHSVAIGPDSSATEDVVISLGSAGNERRFSNLAAGVNGTDGVNLNQLNGFASRSDATKELAENNRRGIAIANAMTVIPPRGA